jgi:hypothetical protein
LFTIATTDKKLSTEWETEVACCSFELRGFQKKKSKKIENHVQRDISSKAEVITVPVPTKLEAVNNNLLESYWFLQVMTDIRSTGGWTPLYHKLGKCYIHNCGLPAWLGQTAAVLAKPRPINCSEALDSPSEIARAVGIQPARMPLPSVG